MTHLLLLITDSLNQSQEPQQAELLERVRSDYLDTMRRAAAGRVLSIRGRAHLKQACLAAATHRVITQDWPVRIGPYHSLLHHHYTHRLCAAQWSLTQEQAGRVRQHPAGGGYIWCLPSPLLCAYSSPVLCNSPALGSSCLTHVQLMPHPCTHDGCAGHGGSSR